MKLICMKFAFSQFAPSHHSAMIYAMTMSHNAPVRLLSTSTRETVTKIEVNLFNLIFDEISRMKKGSFKKKVHQQI